MELEQALFTSTRSQNLSGYHLVARSAGIDETIAQALCRWCPSHDALLGRQTTSNSLNFFQLDQDRFAISRTVLGGPEYSGRGGLQTVTMILVARREQLGGYGNDPVAMARVAMTSGYLTFIKSHCFSERATLPDSDCRSPLTCRRISHLPFVGEAVQQLSQSASIALLDAANAQLAVQSVLHRMPVDQRLDVSFTTGLKPSSQRAFRIHHVSRPGIDIRAYFSRLGTRMISVPPKVEKPNAAPSRQPQLY